MHENLSHKSTSLTDSPRFLPQRDVIFPSFTVCLRHPKDEEVFNYESDDHILLTSSVFRAMNFIRCPLLTSDGWRRKKRWLLLEIHSLPLAALSLYPAVLPAYDSVKYPHNRFAQTRTYCEGILHYCVFSINRNFSAAFVRTVFFFQTSA